MKNKKKINAIQTLKLYNITDQLCQLYFNMNSVKFEKQKVTTNCEHETLAIVFLMYSIIKTENICKIAKSILMM
jgi:hypothetical protein